MAGAITTKQGDCSGYKKTERIPYSCKRDPVIIDQTPYAAGENWTANCCHDGVLSGWAIDQPNSFSSFEMNIGNLDGDSNSSVVPPLNLTLAAPGLGYTCNQLEEAPPTVYKEAQGKREEQAFSKNLLLILTLTAIDFIIFACFELEQTCSPTVHKRSSYPKTGTNGWFRSYIRCTYDTQTRTLRHR